MLKIYIPQGEIWDSDKEEFISINAQTLILEHSLLSISKWEAKWHKCYMVVDPNALKTKEETEDYIRCMTINQVDPNVYDFLTSKDSKAIADYIQDSHTGTKITDNHKRPGRKKDISSEEVYAWMVQFGIPFECEKWHINRLMTLIHICSINNAPKKNMSKNEIQNSYRKINEQNRARFHSKG